MRSCFLLLFGLLLSFSACSDSENQDLDQSDSKEQETDYKINPPEWLIGTWEAEDLGASHEFKITKDNVILTQLFTIYNFAEIAKEGYYIIKEVTNTEYEYQINKIDESQGLGEVSIEPFKFSRNVDNMVFFHLTLINDVPLKLKRIKD